MADQYIGEIRYFPYLRGAPSGWLACDGSVQQISNYQQLGALLGTTYGGDGSSTFGLPDLRGRIAIGTGPGYPLGTVVGQETVTLNTQQLPPHNHYLEASTTLASQNDPTGQVFAAGAAGSLLYIAPAQPASLTAMSGTMVGSSGQGLPHENCAPTLVLVACICTDGVWPPQNN